jgi:hypothetical protein
VKAEVDYHYYLQKVSFYLFWDSTMIKLESIQEKSIIPLTKGFSIKIELLLLKQREKFKPSMIIFVSSFYSPSCSSLSCRENVDLSHQDKIYMIYSPI